MGIFKRGGGFDNKATDFLTSSQHETLATTLFRVMFLAAQWSKSNIHSSLISKSQIFCSAAVLQCSLGSYILFDAAGEQWALT